MTSARHLRVDRFHPFVLHRIGLNGTRFPLSIQLGRRGQVSIAHGTALGTSDFVDLASNYLGEFAAIFNVGHTTWFDALGEPLVPHDVAKRQRVDARVYDITWARLARDRSPLELLVVASNRLQALFDGWAPYDVDLLALPREPSAAEVDELILAANTTRWPNGATVLSSVPGASVYYSGHDDNYFYFESRASEVAEAVLTRLLALLAGSVLVDVEAEAELPEPDLQIAAALFSHSDAWVGQAERLADGTVDVHLTPATWKLSDESIPYSPAFSLVLNPSTATWALRPMGGNIETS